jgi:hypothetical protein
VNNRLKSGLPAGNSNSLCDAVEGCISLFIEHEAHTNKVLDQLQRMTTVV